MINKIVFLYEYKVFTFQTVFTFIYISEIVKMETRNFSCTYFITMFLSLTSICNQDQIHSCLCLLHNIYNDFY